MREALPQTLQICITGMHRSGTSMAAGLLHDCGLYLGQESDLIPATEHNADGHWEHRQFVELSDEFLSVLGGGWDFPPEIPSDWHSLSAVQDTRAMAAQLVEKFAGQTVWGWKDPRVCLTLPLWIERLPDMKLVICVRNPLEVAHSLRKRGQMSYALGLNLWTAYNERILNTTGPGQCLVTHYEAYFRNPLLELQRVLRFLGLSVSAAVLDRATSRVQTRLRHHRFLKEQLGNTPAGKAALELYVRMCAEAGWNENAPGPALGPTRQLSVMQYGELVRRIQEVVAQVVPESSTVIVVSRGDDALLNFVDRRACHFPQDDKGQYAGNYPADIEAVIENLRRVHARAGDYLLFPQTGFWWLDHYEGLRQYFEAGWQQFWCDDSCLIYRLTDPVIAKL